MTMEEKYETYKKGTTIKPKDPKWRGYWTVISVNRWSVVAISVDTGKEEIFLFTEIGEVIN